MSLGQTLWLFVLGGRFLGGGLLGGYIVIRLFGKAEGLQMRHMFHPLLAFLIPFITSLLVLLLSCSELLLGPRLY